MSFVTLTIWACWSTSQTLGPPWREHCCPCFKYRERGNEGQGDWDLNKWAGLELKVDLPLPHKARRTGALSYIWTDGRGGNVREGSQCQFYIWFSGEVPLIWFNVVSLANSSLGRDWCDEVPPLPAPHWAVMLPAREGARAKGMRVLWPYTGPAGVRQRDGCAAALQDPCALLRRRDRAPPEVGPGQRLTPGPKSHVLPWQETLCFACRNGNKARGLPELVLECCGFARMQLWAQKKNFERIQLFCLQGLLPFYAAEWKHWYTSGICRHGCLLVSFVKGISAMRTNSLKSVFRVI